MVFCSGMLVLEALQGRLLLPNGELSAMPQSVRNLHRRLALHSQPILEKNRPDIVWSVVVGCSSMDWASQGSGALLSRWLR